jgi:hypothetical protein
MQVRPGETGGETITMKTSLFPVVASLALLAGGAQAQIAGAAATAFRVQNFDIAELCTIHSYPPQTVPGSNVALTGDTGGGCFSEVLGYQFARVSAATFSIELVPDYHSGGWAYSNSTYGSTSQAMEAHTAGVRVMVPLQKRISVYGSAGGGGGTFYQPAFLPTTPAVLTEIRSVHGVIDFAGGVDLRLVKHFSIRAEVRDFVTGQGLSGVPGRNHRLEAIGIAFHF